MLQAIYQGDSLPRENSFSNGIRVHMRIPAEKIYLGSVIQTLREILDYLNVEIECSKEFILAVEKVSLSKNLFNVVGQTYSNESGFIDWDFFLEDSKLNVILDNKSMEMFEPSNDDREKVESLYIFRHGSGFHEQGMLISQDKTDSKTNIRVRMLLEI
ncbi:hypothetical protein HYY75_06875 [bacterium]|nr:hypothetical protein [bacterium]